MKTFEQCCDEVAKSHGWGSLLHAPRNRFIYMKEAAELQKIDYAREKVIEAIKLARKIIVPENGSLNIMLTEEEILKQLGL